MLPILFEWGPLVLPAWHVAYVLGALAGFALMLQLARLDAPHLTREDLTRLFVVCYLAGYFGARLLSVFIEEPEVDGLGATLMALLRFGPMTFYGGALGAFVAGSFVIRSRRLPFGDVFDCALPAGLLGLAIGRIGCFLNGDDYGRAAPLDQLGHPPAWAVTFPNLGDGVARYPVQLMESAAVACLVLFLCLNFRCLRLRCKPGIVGLSATVTYAILRFAIEYIRDDFRGTVPGTPWSTSQFVSLMLLVVCAYPIWWAVRRYPGKQDQ